MLVARLLICLHVKRYTARHPWAWYTSAQLLVYFIPRKSEENIGTRVRTSVVVIFRCMRSPKSHACENALTEGTKTMHPRPRQNKTTKIKTVIYCSSQRVRAAAILIILKTKTWREGEKRREDEGVIDLKILDDPIYPRPWIKLPSLSLCLSLTRLVGGNDCGLIARFSVAYQIIERLHIHTNKSSRAKRSLSKLWWSKRFWRRKKGNCLRKRMTEDMK